MRQGGAQAVCVRLDAAHRRASLSHFSDSNCCRVALNSQLLVQRQ
jgi:hypothetical protein